MNGLCVYCASSNNVDEVYFDAARGLGLLMARNGVPLVYGGGNIGLMGALARAVHEGGGKVIGVIPSALRARELAYIEADELIVTSDLRERKAVMEARSDAFVALPGGIGTLEEVLEVITLKQLAYHRKPIVFLNTQRFYDPLFAFFDHLKEKCFTPLNPEPLYLVANEPENVLEKAYPG